MPRCAASRRPTLSRYAPVKLPRAWPNSSVSSRLSAIAAQLMAMNGRLARAECAWIYRATTSLPTPLSPVSSTFRVASRRARRRDRAPAAWPGSHRPDGEQSADTTVRMVGGMARRTRNEASPETAESRRPGQDGESSLLEQFPNVRRVRLQADRREVRLKPDATYCTESKTAQVQQRRCLHAQRAT